MAAVSDHSGLVASLFETCLPSTRTTQPDIAVLVVSFYFPLRKKFLIQNKANSCFVSKLIYSIRILLHDIYFSHSDALQMYESGWSSGGVLGYHADERLERRFRPYNVFARNGTVFNMTS